MCTQSFELLVYVFCVGFYAVQYFHGEKIQAYRLEILDK